MKTRSLLSLTSLIQANADQYRREGLFLPDFRTLIDEKVCSGALTLAEGDTPSSLCSYHRIRQLLVDLNMSEITIYNRSSTDKPKTRGNSKKLTDLEARIDTLETALRAVLSQVESLTNRSSGGLSSDFLKARAALSPSTTQSPSDLPARNLSSGQTS